MLKLFKKDTIFGFKATFHWSTVLLSVVCVGAFGPLLGTATALLIICAIVSHELGHALAAKHFGIEVPEIKFNIAGGLTIMQAYEPPTVMAATTIVLAGPIINAALCTLFAIMFLILGNTFVLSPIIMMGLMINLSLVITNLLPIYPLDGGQALYIWLESFYGTTRARDICIGVALAIILVILALPFFLNVAAPLKSGLLIVGIGLIVQSALVYLSIKRLRKEYNEIDF
jgi:Zn-dependent protease